MNGQVPELQKVLTKVGFALPRPCVTEALQVVMRRGRWLLTIILSLGYGLATLHGLPLYGAQPSQLHGTEKAANSNTTADDNVPANATPTKVKVKPTKKSSDGDRVLYQNEAFRLLSDRIIEGDREASGVSGKRPSLINCNAEMVRPQLRRSYPTVATHNPIIDVLYHIALADIEMNIVGGEKSPFLRVSPDFNDAIFTRDTAFASHLGAALVVPDIIKSHLRIDRQLRRKLHFRCPIGEEIPIDGIENEPESISGAEFYEKYGTNAYARRTDDPCWVIGYWAAAQVRGEADDLVWMVDEYQYFDEEFYRHFRDPKDGLYFGQSSFLDIGGTAYPSDYSLQDCLRIKALSTNCLYVQAMYIVAEVCNRLGRAEQAAGYRQRAEELKQYIARAFLHPDGYYAAMIGRDGVLIERREQLGMAFAVLFDVLPPSMFANALDNYPSNSFGHPVFHPFYDGEKVYHNHSIWPFADTYFAKAQLKRYDLPAAREKVLSESLGYMSRNALWGNFAEMFDYATGGWKVKHARSYIWSAAAYLGLVFHELGGIAVTEDNQIRIQPCLPKSFGGKLTIGNLQIQTSRFDIDIQGSGSKIVSMTVDGIKTSTHDFPLDGGSHVISVQLASE